MQIRTAKASRAGCKPLMSDPLPGPGRAHLLQPRLTQRAEPGTGRALGRPAPVAMAGRRRRHRARLAPQQPALPPRRQHRARQRALPCRQKALHLGPTRRMPEASQMHQQMRGQTVEVASFIRQEGQYAGQAQGFCAYFNAVARLQIEGNK